MSWVTMQERWFPRHPRLEEAGFDLEGAVVSVRREELGLTQRELAEVADVSRSLVSGIETDDPNLYPLHISTVGRMAEALGVCADDILRKTHAPFTRWRWDDDPWPLPAACMDRTEHPDIRLEWSPEEYRQLWMEAT